MICREQLIRQAEVTGVAHAIRLGKPFRVGDNVGFNFQLKEYDADTGQELSVSTKVEHHFTVSQSHIDEAIAQINAQQITYREPKLSCFGDVPKELTVDPAGRLVKKL